MTMRGRYGVAGALGVASFIAVYACSSFESTAPADGPDGAVDAQPTDGGPGEDGDAGASMDGGGPTAFCTGHTYCWTFDEADAAVSSAYLAIEDGGYEGSKCLVASLPSTAAASATAHYVTRTQAGPQKRLHVECRVRLDALPTTDGGPSIIPFCNVDDGQGGAAFFVNIQAYRLGDEKRFSVIVAGYDAGVTPVNCASDIANPAAWALAAADVEWYPDGGAHVVVTAGTSVKACDGKVAKPENVSLRPGVDGVFGAAGPPDWKVALDNVVIDVE